MTVTRPSAGFVLIFLLFSLLFFRNTYKLWLKTDEYYQSSTYNMARYDLEAKIFKEFPEIERSFGWKIRPDVW